MRELVYIPTIFCRKFIDRCSDKKNLVSTTGKWKELRVCTGGNNE
jgi:hypothetical protein